MSVGSTQYPVTRTRRQWATLLSLWYTVHGATLLEMVRFIFTTWRMCRSGRLDEPVTIYLHPAAFGVSLWQDTVADRRDNPSPPPGEYDSSDMDPFVEFSKFAKARAEVGRTMDEIRRRSRTGSTGAR